MTMIPTPLPAANGKGKERTPEQIKAGERNFANFQLKGMLGHLRHLHGHVPPEKILAIQESVQAALSSLAKPPAEQFAAPSVPYLENWYVCTHVPTNQLYLRGVIFGHKSIPDNSPVKTNALTGADRSAGTVKTASGSTYLLREGNPSEFNIICLKFGV